MYHTSISVTYISSSLSIIVLISSSTSLFGTCPVAMGGIWTISIVLLLQYSLFIDESFAQNVEAAFRQFGLSPLVVPVPPEERLDVSCIYFLTLS